MVWAGFNLPTPSAPQIKQNQSGFGPEGMFTGKPDGTPFLHAS
jgi:hypothetical protein